MTIIREYYSPGTYNVVRQLDNGLYQLTVQRSENDTDYWTFRTLEDIEKIEELYKLKEKYRQEYTGD